MRQPCTAVFRIQNRIQIPTRIILLDPKITLDSQNCRQQVSENLKSLKVQDLIFQLFYEAFEVFYC